MRLKSCWSSPGHLHDIWGRCHGQIYVAKFKNGNFDINDRPQSKRPSEFDKDHFKALFDGGKLPNKSWIGQKNELRSKNDSQSSLFNGICRKIGSWLPHELSKNKKKSALNCFSTSRPPSSNTQSQTVLFLPNCHGSWEMVPIYKYEAKKEMGGSWRYAKAES